MRSDLLYRDSVDAVWTPAWDGVEAAVDPGMANISMISSVWTRGPSERVC